MTTPHPCDECGEPTATECRGTIRLGRVGGRDQGITLHLCARCQVPPEDGRRAMLRIDNVRRRSR